jgi:hypothetical protein
MFGHHRKHCCLDSSSQKGALSVAASSLRRFSIHCPLGLSKSAIVRLRDITLAIVVTVVLPNLNAPRIHLILEKLSSQSCILPLEQGRNAVISGQ